MSMVFDLQIARNQVHSFLHMLYDGNISLEEMTYVTDAVVYGVMPEFHSGSSCELEKVTDAFKQIEEEEKDIEQKQSVYMREIRECFIKNPMDKSAIVPIAEKVQALRMPEGSKRLAKKRKIDLLLDMVSTKSLAPEEVGVVIDAIIDGKQVAVVKISKEQQNDIQSLFDSIHKTCLMFNKPLPQNIIASWTENGKLQAIVFDAKLETAVIRCKVKAESIRVIRCGA